MFGAGKIKDQGPFVADHADVFAIGDDDGRILVDADAVFEALILHGDQRTSETATDEQVLIDEPFGIDKAQAAVDLFAPADSLLHRFEHRIGVTEHDAAHHRRSGTCAGDDSAFPIDFPHRVEHRSLFAIFGEQRLDDFVLFAADQEDAGCFADLGDQVGV